MLVGVAAHTGVGWAEGMPDKGAKSVLNAVQAILAQVKILHGHATDVSVRFHSDMDKSFEAEVKAYQGPGMKPRTGSTKNKIAETLGNLHMWV